MYKGLLALLVIVLSVIWIGRPKHPTLTVKHESVAQIGNAGSIGGPYGILGMYIKSVGGGATGFGYGAVDGYPGKSSDIGSMGIPEHIEGYWNKGWNDYEMFYYISAPIDSELARKKIHTLQHYYTHYQTAWGSMQVVVEKERVRVLYTLACSPSLNDCRHRDNADPNGWVVKSPEQIWDVVVLFDGKGESSKTPFPGSPYDRSR